MTLLLSPQELSSGSSEMIIVKGYFKVPQEELNIIKSYLSDHITNSLNEDGCLKFEITQDNLDKSIFHVFEKFRDIDAYLEHKKRVKTSKWAKISKNIKRFYNKI